MLFAKSRYAGARTDAAAVSAAVLPGGVIQEPPKFHGQRSALVGLLPFMRTDLRPEYRKPICQDGRQVSRALVCYANVWTITGRPPRMAAYMRPPSSARLPKIATAAIIHHTRAGRAVGCPTLNITPSSITKHQGQKRSFVMARLLVALFGPTRLI